MSVLQLEKHPSHHSTHFTNCGVSMETALHDGKSNALINSHLHQSWSLFFDFLPLFILSIDWVCGGVQTGKAGTYMFSIPCSQFSMWSFFLSWVCMCENFGCWFKGSPQWSANPAAIECSLASRLASDGDKHCFFSIELIIPKTRSRVVNIHKFATLISNSFIFAPGSSGGGSWSSLMMFSVASHVS